VISASAIVSGGCESSPAQRVQVNKGQPVRLTVVADGHPLLDEPLAGDIAAALALLHGRPAADAVLRRYVVAAVMLGAAESEAVAWAIRRRVGELSLPEDELVDYAIAASQALSAGGSA
jgi:hypothetical protein